jgi:hypothetical protein
MPAARDYLARHRRECGNRFGRHAPRIVRDVAEVLDDHRINRVPLENIELQEGLVVHLLHGAVVQRCAGSASRWRTPMIGFFEPKRSLKVMCK